MPAEVKNRAKLVKMLVLDVDGVLTDGGLYYDHQGNVSKRFHVHDGLGIKLAQAAGLEIAVITGLVSEAVESRVRELGIREYFAGHLDKRDILRGLAERYKLDFEEIAYIGDDWVDAGPLRMVGFPVCVANAQPEVLELAAMVTKAHGGQGAVREVIRYILTCQNKYETLWLEWGA